MKVTEPYIAQLGATPLEKFDEQTWQHHRLGGANLRSPPICAGNKKRFPKPC